MNEYTYEDIAIGHQEAFEVVVTAEMEDSFRAMTGDINPLHRDDKFAAGMEGHKFKSHVTFGMLTASMLSTLAGVYLPGKYSLIHSIEVGFVQPVYAGDTLTIAGKCVDKQDGLNLISLKVLIKNQMSETVSKAKMKVVVLK